MTSSIDYNSICFVIMPFGHKPVGPLSVDFDTIYEHIFVPAISSVELPEGGKLNPPRADKDFFSGDIGQEMFLYLDRSRISIADISGLNANVMYELGVRHASRASGTVMLRQIDSPIPFDVNHIKAFPYSYQPEEQAEASRHLIQRVLTESLARNHLDSPVQIALRAERARPKLEPLLIEAENAIRRMDPLAAIAALQAALRVDARNPHVHHRLGLLLRGQGELQAALEQFNAALAALPEYSDAWREKGITESLLSRKPGWPGDSGEVALSRAIALNADDYDALASLGGVLRRQGRTAEALQSYERAAQVTYGHPYPLLMALKLRARITGQLTIDGATRAQLQRASRMRSNQAAGEPPLDPPWCFFDLAEIRLYLGEPTGFTTWMRRGLERCDHRWQAETFLDALQLLAGSGVALEGLSQGIAELTEAAQQIPV